MAITIHMAAVADIDDWSIFRQELWRETGRALQIVHRRCRHAGSRGRKMLIRSACARSKAKADQR